MKFVWFIELIKLTIWFVRDIVCALNQVPFRIIILDCSKTDLKPWFTQFSNPNLTQLNFRVIRCSASFQCSTKYPCQGKTSHKAWTGCQHHHPLVLNLLIFSLKGWSNSAFQCSTRTAGADLGGGCRGCAPQPPKMTCGFLIQLVFCKKKKLCGLLMLK